MSPVESNVDSPVNQSQPGSPHRSLIRALARGVTGGAVIALAIIVFVGARRLWQEWVLLQEAVGGAQASALVGFRDISPTASYAQPPGDRIRQEGNETLLWSRWEIGVGHRWFRFAQGDIDPAHLSHPETVMVSRAIDHPVVESSGGTIWKRLPPECTVIGHKLVGLRCAYPVTVLGKVQVINDVVEDHPYLIVVNLFAADKEAYSIFEAELDGHRVTMAASGYFHDGKPLLYDRGTESLWLEESDHLKAAAGKHKGARLARVAKLAPVTWKSWLAQSEDCRLLVGADRSQATPRE
jgi:Protein of unknown function (DUF3179)